MRRVAAVALALVAASACGAGGFSRDYEYEEDLHLSLDGRATLYVNSSLAALNRLHGASFDQDPVARVDRAKVRAFFSSAVTHVQRVTSSRRKRRRFVHVRLEVDDVGRLGRAPAFAWSTYQFRRDGDRFVFRQGVGAAMSGAAAAPGLTGRELVAFRLHLPAKIVYHNAPPDNLKRGNILVWEQSLDDRQRGVPLRLEARMETQSILSRTLWLFGTTVVAVAVMFVALVWWLLRRHPDAVAERT